jgi:hypothetical protein
VRQSKLAKGAAAGTKERRERAGAAQGEEQLQFEPPLVMTWDTSRRGCVPENVTEG